MIKEFEFYHGAAIARLIHEASIPISVKTYSANNASYIINDNKGIYIKHCTKRMTPWRFSFKDIHYKEMLEVKEIAGELYLLLVCGSDGIVVLNYQEIKSIIVDTNENSDWISIIRRPYEEYAVKGSDGKLNFKVSQSDFPSKIFSQNF